MRFKAGAKVKVIRTTAPSTDGHVLERHESNPWYRASIVAVFERRECYEVEFADTQTRTFVTEREVKGANE